jgi:hypothetical protein
MTVSSALYFFLSRPTPQKYRIPKQISSIAKAGAVIAYSLRFSGARNIRNDE